MTETSAAPAGMSAGSMVLLLVVTLAATAGLSAVWAGASVMLGGNATWMTLVAALDAALLLRLAGHPPGMQRALMALFITGLAVLAAAALVSSAKIGLSMGMRPVESLQRMSFELATLYLRANLGWVDAFWLAAGGLLAWRTGR